MLGGCLFGLFYIVLCVYHGLVWWAWVLIFVVLVFMVGVELVFCSLVFVWVWML